MAKSEKSVRHLDCESTVAFGEHLTGEGREAFCRSNTGRS